MKNKKNWNKYKNKLIPKNKNYLKFKINVTKYFLVISVFKNKIADGAN